MHSHSVAHSQADKLLDDPWSLTLPEREELLATRSDSQAKWMSLLPDLIEPPTPEPSFPAFLLDTEPFARLREAIGEAQSRRDLDTATADELQHFVDCYRSYLQDGAGA